MPTSKRTTKQKKNTSRSETGSKPLSRSLRIYQRIAILFVVLSFVLLLFVLYLSISSATIRVVPNAQVVSHEVAMEIVPDARTHGQVSGYVRQRSVELSETFDLPEDGAVAQEAKAGGLVTLVNTTGSDQPLVATTRLLSGDGVLFRIEEGVTVPAEGQVTTMAYADLPGLGGEIPPSDFTIPGLPATLQDDIYAISETAMTGGVQYIQTLNDSHVQDAYEQLKLRAKDEAVAALSAEINTEVFDGLSVDVVVVEQGVEPEIGSETGIFTASVTATVTGLFYDQDAVYEYIGMRLQEQVGKDYELAKINDEYVVEVRNVDIAKEKADIRVYSDGVAIISTASDILDKRRLLGRTPKEARTILENSELIESISIRFTPFWLQRIPTLEDHIKIIVEQP